MLTSCLFTKSFIRDEEYADAVWLNNDSVIVIYRVFNEPGLDSLWIYLVNINDEYNRTLIYESNEGYNSPTRYIEGDYYLYYTAKGTVYFYSIANEELNEISGDDWEEEFRYNILNDEIIYINDDKLIRKSLEYDTEYIVNEGINHIYYIDWSQSRLIGGNEEFILEIDIDSNFIDTVASFDDTISIVYNLRNPIIVDDLYDSTRLLMYCEGTKSSEALLTIDKTTNRYEFGTVINELFFRRNKQGDYMKFDDDIIDIYNENGEVREVI